MVLLGCLSTLTFSRISEASEWSGEASVQLRQEYNDNIRLTTTPHDPVWGNTASSLLKVNALTERLQMKATALAEVIHYLEEKDLDAVDYNLRLSPLYRAERNIWELDGAYTQDLTLGSELGETGLVLTRNRRRSWTVNPSWTWLLMETASLQWQYQFTDVRYPGEKPGLVDYQIHGGKMQFYLPMTEKNKVTTEVNYTHYRALSVDFRSENYGIQAGTSHFFSQTLSGMLSGGVYRTLSTIEPGGVPIKDRHWGWLVNGNLEKQSDRTVLLGGLSREIQPSGAGYPVRVDRLSGQVRQELMPTLTASLSTDFYWSEALRTDVVIPGSRYYKINAGWNWRWRESWFLEVTYSHAGQKYENAPAAATSNAVYWRITYNSSEVAFSP